MNLDTLKHSPRSRSYRSIIQSPDELETLLIRSVYRAAYDPDEWLNVLNILCRSCGAQAAKLVLVDTLNSKENFSVSVGVHPDKGQKSELLTYAVPLFISPKQVNVSGLYTWFFMKPTETGTDDWIASTVETLIQRAQLLNNKRYMAFLLLQHPAHNGEFSWVDSRLINVLKTHFKQAILLFTKTHDTLMNWQLESDALDIINVGIVVTDSQGRILRHNQTAWHYLTDNDGLYIHNNAVTTERNRQCSFISALYRSVEDNYSGIQIVLRPSGQPGYQICYFPVSEEIRNTSDKTGLIMLFIFDPSHISNTLMDSLEVAYGLSKGESRLATEISRGMSADEYAEKYGVSVSTVRTQLRSVYKRTGTKGQIKLAGLLRGLEFLNLSENIDKKMAGRKRKKRQRRMIDLSELVIPNRDL